MATVFLGYRRAAYDRLSASWKDNYWSVLRRTNIQVTRCHQAETVTKVVTYEFQFFITMHQRSAQVIGCSASSLQLFFVQLNHPAQG